MQLYRMEITVQNVYFLQFRSVDQGHMHRVCNWCNTTGARSGAHEFTPGFQQGSCYSICSCMCNVL